MSRPVNKLTPIFIAGALFAAGGLAYAQSQMRDQEPTVNHGEHASHGASTGLKNPVARAYSEISDRMLSDRAIEVTGGANVDFMRGMIPRREGAIDMARAVLEHASDPEVWQFA